MFKRTFILVLLTVILATLTLTACATPVEEAEPAESETGEEMAEEVAPLKVAVLPVLDVLPLYIAQENGYFEEAGVEVEAVPVTSAVERDQLMQAGEIDGMLNEIATTALFNRDGVKIQAVIASRVATSDGPIFRIIASPSSEIETPADLAGVPIGVSVNTVIEYLTDRILEEEGLSSDQIVSESVPSIPERFQLLMEGQLQAATLPDPLAQAALEAGAKLVVEDSDYPFYSLSTLTFSVETIESNPEGLRRFLIAWDRAVQDLNADPEAYRGLFLEKVPTPESVQETYEIPPFPSNQVPTADQWADVNDWLLDKGLIESALPYEESVTAEFLPGS